MVNAFRKSTLAHPCIRDPVLINSIAKRRKVVLFDNRGVGRTEGEVPDNFQAWADDMVSFIQRLGYDKADLFEYSMGGRVVQTLCISRPALVRKVILAGGSAVQPTPNSPKDTRETKYMMGMATAETYEQGKDAFRLTPFGESLDGAQQFDSYWRRLQERSVEPLMLDPLLLDRGGTSQIAAVLNADKKGNIKLLDPLADLRMPVLIANGNKDLTLGLVRTLDLQDRLNNSQLVLYPNSGHGFLWQYGAVFAEQVNLFLDSNAFDCD